MSKDAIPSSLTASTTDTPMLAQYKAIKRHHLDAILFFRLGDFYEMFLDDAIIASKELGLTLTGRGKDDQRIAMCGVPHHAADSYIGKLVKKSYKVAICEQTEDASESKGITKRDVVKIITPGTVLDQNQLDEQSNNYIASLQFLAKRSHISISYSDISTGEFVTGIISSITELHAQLERLGCRELLIDTTAVENKHPFIDTLQENTLVNSIPMLPPHSAEIHLKTHFNCHSLHTFGIDHLSDAFPSAWALLSYIQNTQKTLISHIKKISPIQNDHTLFLDRSTIKNLELTQSIYPHQKQGTLFWVLDHHKTSMGARRTKSLLTSPYVDPQPINYRLDAVEHLKNDLLSREEIRDILVHVYDLERLVSRLSTERHNPKDCIALKQSLVALNTLGNTLNECRSDLIAEFAEFFTSYTSDDQPFQRIIRIIETAIVDDPPPHINGGHIIKAGYNAELDEHIQSFKDIKQWIANLEESERKESGIKTLKVRFNKVFGYYIEVSHSQKDNVPDHYIRKQTLANSERFITPELKEKERLLLSGEEKQIDCEIRLYHDILHTLKTYIPELQELASVIAELDSIQSFATAAQKYNYCRPQIDTDGSHTLYIENGRHPVIEQSSTRSFTPNTLSMTEKDQRFILITGPNMAGKSTLMRQIALCVIMAQCGSFVPADVLKLSPVDKCFTRIGALDNIYAGQSTFMVEMLESATILNGATHKSLIILDEIGRGTATFDGMSIATAITEHIHTKIKARTLFATHYHELTILSKQYPELSNASMAISDIDGTLVFKHKLIQGPADKSYGIHVAKMAGLPTTVIEKAQQHLNGFEHHGANYLHQRMSKQLPLF